MSVNTANRDYQKMAHLLRRAGFGANQQEIEAGMQKGLEATIQALVYATPEPESSSESQELDFRNFSDLQTWWLRRMGHTPHPLQEKMTLFWHGHFATAYAKVKEPNLMLRQNQLLRHHALGNFQAFTQAVSKDPAMILYLDNQTNRKGHPNENYARELFELFTLGIGNYTEQDIKEAARAFTGWTYNPSTQEFYFAQNQHDDDPKTVFGKTGNWNGEEIVDMAVHQPACATFVCTKLFKFFVHDNPKPKEIKPFADLFVHSNYALKPVLEAMFHSTAFYSEKAMWGKLKSPVEFVVGAIRTTQAQLPARFAPQALRAMGQEPFNPPSVKGWDGGTTWINTTTLLTRFNFTMQLARLSAESQPLLQAVTEQISQHQLKSPEAVVDYVTAQILQRPVSPKTRSTLLAYLQTGQDGMPHPLPFMVSSRPDDPLIQKIQGLIHVTLLTPEYQLC